VIVEVVQQFDVAVIEAENQPPVAAYRDRPIRCEIALERMRPSAWHIDIACIHSSIQNRQYACKAFGMIGTNAFGSTGFEKCLDALVSKAFYHARSVM
jgi:hypothetical protein